MKRKMQNWKSRKIMKDNRMIVDGERYIKVY